MKLILIFFVPLVAAVVKPICLMCLSRKQKAVIVMCDISKKYRFRDNFVDIVIVLIFDTALADFDIYRKGDILR